jgi:hypothetical protein
MRERSEFEEEMDGLQSRQIARSPHQSRAVGTTTSLVGALHHQHRQYAALLESDSTFVTIVSSHYSELFTRV